MKKIALALIATILMTGAVMAQASTKNQGYVMGYVIPTQTTQTTEYIKKNSFVYITSDTTLYLTKINIGVGSRMSTTLLASAGNYSVINRAIFGGKAISFFVDTANAQNVYGVKTFKNNATFAGTVGVTGNVAVNTNKFNVTAASGNTAIAGTLGVAGNFAVNTNKFTVDASGNVVADGTLGVTGFATLKGLSATDSIIPFANGNGRVGTLTHRFTSGYINTVYTTVLSPPSGGTLGVTATTGNFSSHVGVSGTDTVTSTPVGGLCYRAADSTMYLKIRLTGPKSARWQKITVGK